MRDLLTMVIPYRRNLSGLKRALKAVEGWRVLVVDDSDAGLDLDVPRRRLGGGQGFSKAANIGLEATKTPYALLLNDDAVPLEDCLERLIHQSGLCGPLLVGPQGVESAGLRVRSWGRVVQQRTPGRVDALSGACLHMPASVRFDEKFRHGSEDVELCLRLTRQGLSPILVSEARCWHQGGATLSRRSPAARRHALSGQLRLWGRGWRQGVVLGLAVGQVLREGAGREGLGALRAGWRDFWEEEEAV
ncbi:MAG TPA: glycosyltransferase [Myxococcota bacterium]|nr:glycosyltransferase [Myxococcota bacterium]